jgi:hypothetical protein
LALDKQKVKHPRAKIKPNRKRCIKEDGMTIFGMLNLLYNIRYRTFPTFPSAALSGFRWQP